METFADWSDTTFTAAKPYDETRDRTFLERLHKGEGGFGAAYDAAKETGRALDSLTSSGRLREDWFDAAADRIKAVSGVTLANPRRIDEYGLLDDAVARGLTGERDWAGATFAARERDFFGKLA